MICVGIGTAMDIYVLFRLLHPALELWQQYKPRLGHLQVLDCGVVYADSDLRPSNAGLLGSAYSHLGGDMVRQANLNFSCENVLLNLQL